MDMACALARRGMGKASPNPMVGAVLARDGQVLATGWHRRPGTPHAEVIALRRAGPEAKGSTLFVNLEPCAHQGRTPPCVGQILEAGIRRVVIGTRDPNPRVNGRSIRLLRSRGVETTCDVRRDKCRQLNEAFFKSMETGKPLVTLKAALSLDGRIACHTGVSQWISCEASRRKAHRLRSRVDAILVGAGTVVEDDPRLTVRGIPGARNPLRVVIDSTLRSPPGRRVFLPDPPTLVATTTRAPAKRVERLRRKGLRVETFRPDRTGRVPFSGLLRWLGAQEIRHLLLEGGSGVYTTALEANEVDRCLLFIAPLLLGGTAAPGLVGGKGARRPELGHWLHRVRVSRSDQDLVVEGYLKGRDPVAGWAGEKRG